MTVPGNIDTLLLGGLGGYQIERSLRFNRPDSAYLGRTPSVAGNRRTWTWSGWIKRSSLGIQTALFHAYDGSSSRRAQFYFDTSDRFAMNQGGGGTTAIGNTTAVFRDVSAWYHFLFYADYTNTTFKLYVNNVEQTISYSSSVINADGQINATIAHQVGADDGSGAYFAGYMAEVHFIDGQALTPSSFGETDTITGVWKPKRYSGTYGTNGFYLKFADNSGTTSTTLGKDSSGNGNNWTPNNFSVTAGAGNDSLIDTPTPYADGGNGRGNYCTWNPIAVSASASTFSNGNLDITTPSSNGGNVFGTFAIPNTGKWYWEVVSTAGSDAMIGISPYLASANYQTVTGAIFYFQDGRKFISGTGTAYGASYTTNDVIGIAVDADAGTITFYKNNSSQGAISGTVAGLFPSLCDGSGAAGNSYTTNFGQRAFAYTPPSGFLALNTQNLPEPTIKKPSSYMDVVTYTGNGSARSITGLGFSPDFVWIKKRDTSTNGDHELFDAVRGTTKYLNTNNGNTEGTDAQSLTAFNSNGFSLGTNSFVNFNGNTFVAWAWDESATPGFDIVTYTGNSTNRTIAHSLGVTPSFLIVKNRDSVKPWRCWFTGFTGDQYITLNETSARETLSTMWGSATPTSTTFAVGTRDETNNAGNNYVAYLWSEVAGFSKFGSYTGNGSTDGPFVHLGFRPRWVMIKCTSTTENWAVKDTARNPTNTNNTQLFANLNAADDVNNTYHMIDFLSNGLKIRGAAQDLVNGSGQTYIFAAFAESPFKYSLAR